MGRHKKGWVPPAATSSSAKAPVMKYQEASRMADKNAKTIAKVSQLLEVIHDPNYEKADPYRYVEKYVEKLKKRVNRRLKKLAKWSDSSADDRQAEFRVYNRGYGSSSRNYVPPSFPQRAATLPPSNLTIGGLSRPAPTNTSATIGGALVKAPTASTVIGGSVLPSTDGASRVASFPLLASALAEQQQRKEQQPSTAMNAALNSVREQLQSELQQKDSEREELIQQLQKELREAKQPPDSSLPTKMDEDKGEAKKEDLQAVGRVNKDNNEDVEGEDVMEVEQSESVEVVEDIPASLHAPLTDAISEVNLEK